jgi:hypothetical protein
MIALLDGREIERVVGDRASDYGWGTLEASYCWSTA